MTIRRFKLSDKFVESYRSKPVPWGPVGEITYRRTYSRKMENGLPEQWVDTCRRVIEGMFNMQKNHCIEHGLPWSDEKAQKTAKDAFERLFVLKWTPPGRGLWTAGTEFVEQRTGAALFNCGFASTQNLSTKGAETWRWVMDALMLGIGVGFDTKGAGTFVIQKPGTINKISIPVDPVNLYVNIENKPYCIIDDSREGWTESVYTIIDAFYKGTILPNFDYSKIRDRGVPIKGFGGTSSGYGPLKELHEALVSLYTKLIDLLITSIAIVDTENLIGRCVVAGNVRRSAALAMGQPNDKEFTSMKDPHLFPEELAHHRWGSNNSIEATIGMDYTSFAEQCQNNGEPGFIWLHEARTHGRFKDGIKLDDLRIMGFNPCVEQQLEDRELCCLVETYPWKHETYEDYLATMKIAYLYGKTVTLAKTTWAETNAIMLKNRRIGLSISGFEQACNKFGQHQMYTWCDSAYEYVKQLDSTYSDWLCIPRSKRMTSIKPSGTVSLLNGSTPGMHWPIAEYMVRRIVFDDLDPLLQELKSKGFYTEPSKYYPNSHVVSFPMKTEYYSRSEAEVSMWEQLERAAQLQYYWADNSVSVTVKFQPTEASQIKYALEAYQTRLKAVSFLRYDDSGYEQMPYEPITKDLYESLLKGITDTSISSNQIGIGEAYCDSDKCLLPSL